MFIQKILLQEATEEDITEEQMEAELIKEGDANDIEQVNNSQISQNL